MKNNSHFRYFALLIVCSVLLGQTSARAQNAVSQAEVNFVAGTGPTSPVNPEDPNVDGNEGPVEGSFAIVSVSQFDFGTIKVAATELLIDTETWRPNIQVVDLRGTAAGWNVTAEASRFMGSEGYTLPGAAIYIDDGRPNSLSTSPAPDPVKNVKLTTDGVPVRVITAKKDAGTGLWVMRWYPDEDDELTPDNPYIKLEIPAGAGTTGGHTATINWILGNTP